MLNGNGSEKIASLRNELQTIMMEKCSVFRNEADLEGLIKEISILKDRAERLGIKDRGKKFNTDLLEAIELGHLITLGEVIARSALERKESRGSHYREDFPVRDDENWLKHTFAFKTDGGIEFRYKPVTITRFKPEERKY